MLAQSRVLTYDSSTHLKLCNLSYNPNISS